jgi:hypothetical protein
MLPCAAGACAGWAGQVSDLLPLPMKPQNGGTGRYCRLAPIPAGYLLGGVAKAAASSGGSRRLLAPAAPAACGTQGALSDQNSPAGAPH